MWKKIAQNQSQSENHGPNLQKPDTQEQYFNGDRDSLDREKN